jgi:CheY-like chemotaxis protein
VVITVRDTGIGIPAEHLPHIFEMFSQVTPALERAQGGLGIGLSLVRGLVELHGGRVDARSDGEGRGAEFVVRLPALEAPPGAEDGADGERRPARAGSSRRVLVVDDNRDAADSLGAVLQLAGHEVRTAYDGEAAVYSAATWQPEVVLLDIGLPGMNGYEAAARIRGAPWGAGMVLVAVTGWGQEEDKRRAAESGFDVHLTKPVDLDSLASLLAVQDGHTGGSLAPRAAEPLSS